MYRSRLRPPTTRTRVIAAEYVGCTMDEAFHVELGRDETDTMGGPLIAMDGLPFTLRPDGHTMA